ncbi:MAG: hypoxanthine-guanine phosphoribosyltransferase [Burkholderiales bacterium]|nr:hypoxanthine-guanine phosphoribosyltransferase [Burkholderiales bacterium]
MPDAEQAWRMLEEADLLVPAEAVEAAIARLAGEITDAFRDRYPVLLCVMNGAVFFCGQLLPRLRFPLHLDYVHATRYGKETRGQELVWHAHPPDAVKGRAVLVLDDILDLGETLAAIKRRVLELGADSCHVAVLTDKRKRAPKPVKADFVGVEVEDRFVFGCGLDAHGLWRNLPAIYAMRET